MFFLSSTPLKINGWNIIPWRFGSDHVPFFSSVICRFQPLIFQGAHVPKKKQHRTWQMTPGRGVIPIFESIIFRFHVYCFGGGNELTSHPKPWKNPRLVSLLKEWICIWFFPVYALPNNCSLIEHVFRCSTGRLSRLDLGYSLIVWFEVSPKIFLQRITRSTGVTSRLFAAWEWPW